MSITAQAERLIFAIAWSIALGLARMALAADGPQPMSTTRADLQAEAQAILGSRGLEARPGVCLFLGDSEGLAIELARQSQMTVYMVSTDAEALLRAREAVDAAGLSALRVRVEQGPLERLEYPTYCANLIVCQTFPAAPLTELWRVSRPGATVFVGEPATRPAAIESNPGFKVVQWSGPWARIERPALEGAAEWTHFFQDPTNNRFSLDRNIRHPLGLLWYQAQVATTGRFWASQGLTAGGRLFITGHNPDDRTLAHIMALDAYNGVLLWQRQAGGDRYTRLRGTSADDRNWLAVLQTPGAVQPGELAVSAQKVYLADSQRCLVLDAATGQDAGEFKAPPPTPPGNCWRFVAYDRDTLYGYTDGPDSNPQEKWRVPPKEGQATVFALDLASGKCRWIRSGVADDPLGKDFTPPLAIGNERVFVRAGKDTLYALDARTGKTVWSSGGLEIGDTWWEAVLHRGDLYLDRYNLRTYGAKRNLGTVIFRAADGQAQRPTTQQDIRYSPEQQLCRTLAGPGGHCQYLTAAGDVRFDRDFYRVGQGGTQTYNGFRIGCLVGALPANGLVHVVPLTNECACASFRGTITLMSGITFERVSPGSLPKPVVEAAPPDAAPAAQLAAQTQPADDDWPTFRADVARTAVTWQDLTRPARPAWQVKIPGVPTAPVAVGDLVYFGSTDECVHALDAAMGKTRWKFHTAGPVRGAPAYWNGRLYAGSDDGWVYCLAADTGGLLWRLRAAPFGRRQMGLGTIVSAWPVQQGLAVDKGVVYFAAGLVPSQRTYQYAVDAIGGTVLWRSDAGGSDIVPRGAVALSGERAFFPSVSLSHLLQLNRSDGKPPAKTVQRGSFDQISYIAAESGDAADGSFAGGLLAHGGFGLARYNVARRSFNYRVLAAPWADSAGAAEQGALSSCHAPVMPVFGGSLIYFDENDKVVAVSRADLRPLTTRKDRDSLVRWGSRQGEKPLPCGEPQWLALAAGIRANPKPVLLVGGPTGVTALDGTTGKPLWTVKLDAATAEPAIARRRVFLTSPDGTVRCLAAQ